MNEQQIQRKITKHLEKVGAYTFKIVTANRAGIPDIIAVIRGSFIGIEVKTPKGRVSALQEYNGEKIVEAGGNFLVARSLDDVKKFLKDQFGIDA